MLLTRGGSAWRSRQTSEGEHMPSCELHLILIPCCGNGFPEATRGSKAAPLSHRPLRCPSPTLGSPLPRLHFPPPLRFLPGFGGAHRLAQGHGFPKDIGLPRLPRPIGLPRLPRSIRFPRLPRHIRPRWPWAWPGAMDLGHKPTERPEANQRRSFHTSDQLKHHRTCRHA